MVSSILKRIQDEKRILAIIGKASDIKEHFDKVESMILILKQQRKTTYKGIQSMNIHIQREAIQRKQNIEKTIHDLRTYRKYLADDDINRIEESKIFINKLYSNINGKNKKIDQERIIEENDSMVI